MTDSHVYFKFQLTGEYNSFFFFLFFTQTSSSVIKISTEHLASINYEDPTFNLVEAWIHVCRVDAVQLWEPHQGLPKAWNKQHIIQAEPPRTKILK